MTTDYEAVRARLARWMGSSDVRVENIRGDGYHADEGGWEHHRFRFDLYAGSFDRAGFVVGNAIYRQGLGRNEDPTAVDIFSAILNDISCIGGCDDWLDFAESLGYEPTAPAMRKARDDYAGIATRRDLLVERIGGDALTTMIEVAREL